MTLNEVMGVVKVVLRPIARSVRLMVARGLVRLVNDGTGLQLVQVEARADDLYDRVERFQEYGFTSTPAPGAEALLLLVGGNGDHPVVVAVEDRLLRPTGLAEGEVALYTKAHAKRVYLRTNGDVELGTAPTDYVALATLVKQELTALRNTLNDLVAAYNSHTHAFSGTTASSCTAGGATGTCSGTAAATSSTTSAPAAVNDVKAAEVKAK